MTLPPSLKRTIEATPTAQLRRVTIPKHRRLAQVKQTVLALVVFVPLVGFVWLVDAPKLWYLVAFLFCLRIANRDLLIDCLKIAKDVVALRGPNA